MTLGTAVRRDAGRQPELLLIHPGGRSKIYQELASTLTAVEPPMWCRLIAGYVLDRGHACEIVDAEALDLDPTDVAKLVVEHEPLLVAVVTYGHQPSASTQKMVPSGDICRAIKASSPDQPIIMVGGHVAALPERTLAEEPIDFSCNGEGPVTVERLLAALKDANPAYGDIPGLVWRDGGTLRNNKAAPLITDLDKDLHGQTWHLLPMERYRAHNWQCFGDLGARQPYASIYTSLGCPYKCSFCCINAPFGTNRYRMRSPAKVIEEIEHLHTTFGVCTFKIIDEMFVLNDRHVREICQGLAAKPFAPKLNIWAYARVDTVKADAPAMLRAAGIRWLALGIESGSEHVRDGAHKSFDHDDIVEVVHTIQKAGIHVIANYIFGLPDDDQKSMRATLELAKTLNCEFANLYSTMAYPGSPLYTEAVQKGLQLPADWSGYSQHSANCTPLPTETLSSAEVLRFRDQAFQEYFSNPRYLAMITQKFGVETADHIRSMMRARLPRNLLDAPAPATR